MNNIYLKSIESFPPLRESINQINMICNNEYIDYKALAYVIESDPILYTDILRYANAPHHGFSQTIISITQVVSLFGVCTIRGMALTAALKAHPFNNLSEYETTVNMWFKTMELQQRFLDLWLFKTHRPILQSLGGLTFILEIGRLVTSYVLMSRDISHTFASKTPYELSLEEANLLGHSGDELAAKLFNLWYFDDFLIDSLYYCMTPEKGLQPETCAILKCARTLFSLNGVALFEEIEPILEHYNLPISEALHAYENLLKEL